ncbi:hypothetical protein [Paucibacter soli]|uniref:hypothetical protein n=1 Tax=Paucibacter soli TaxID=3133433 RepID=UPI0030ADD2A4
MRLIDLAVEEAKGLLSGQADNPEITRVGGGGSFTVGAAALSAANNWSVARHDWLAQYQVARELLTQHRFAALRDVLAGKGCETDSLGKVSFAPEVVAVIRRVTGSLDLKTFLDPGSEGSSPMRKLRF